MAVFERETLTIGNVQTVVYTAGNGKPLVFFHGAGTAEGFQFAAPWAEEFKVIYPYHPGFGESGDDASFTDLHDYVMHYLELFDALGLNDVNLVGVSFGGHLAARFASEHGNRIRKLALIAPAGMHVPEFPATDLISLPGDQLVHMLVSNPATLAKVLPERPGLDFIADRYREATTYARLFWERPIDRRLERYLHRLKMPTYIVWGERDLMIPLQHLERWKKSIPQAETKVVPGVGHLVHFENPEVLPSIARFLK